MEPDADRAFTRFVKETEPRLSYALAAAYGLEVGAEATADALVWAWEHWESLNGKRNPAGYLYRVGQSKARRYHRPRVLFPEIPTAAVPSVEPGLTPALASLSKRAVTCAAVAASSGSASRIALR